MKITGSAVLIKNLLFQYKISEKEENMHDVSS